MKSPLLVLAGMGLMTFGSSAAPPKVSGKEVQVLPFLWGGAGFESKKFKLDDPRIPKQFNVALSLPSLRISGIRQNVGSVSIDGVSPYGVGKMVLLPGACKSGTLTVRKRTEGIGVCSVIELPDGKIACQTLPVQAGKTYKWSVDGDESSGGLSMEVRSSDNKPLVRSDGVLGPLVASEGKILGRGFAVFGFGGGPKIEVDLVFTYE